MTKSALLLIDLQNDYFPGGKWTLHGIEAAASNAAKILNKARNEDQMIIHVHHEFTIESPPFFAPDTPGAQIHETVAPKDGERKILKHKANAFYGTPLKEVLDENGVGNLTIIGAMSHMCIDAATRAAADYGYSVTVVEDACASRDLEFQGRTVKAEDVHAAYMSALGFGYAQVTTTENHLAG